MEPCGRIFTVLASYGDDMAQATDIERHLPLVRKIARWFHRRLGGGNIIEVDDLVHEGVLGLAHALDTYDADRGVSPEQWVSIRIAGAMRDHCRSWDRLGRRARRMVTELHRTRSVLEQSECRAVADAEVEAVLGQRTVDYHPDLSLDRMFETESFDVPVEFANLFADPARGPDEQACISVDGGDILTSLMQMGGQEGPVLRAWYLAGASAVKIGRSMGCHPSRVSQIHKSGLKKLRFRFLFRAWTDRRRMSHVDESLA